LREFGLDGFLVLMIQMTLNTVELSMLDEVIDACGFCLVVWECRKKDVRKEFNNGSVH
jgi:hypothetical protein